MPGIIFYAVTALAVALLGHGALNKLAQSSSSSGIGTSLQNKIFDEVTRDHEITRNHPGISKKIGIRSERIAVCGCSALGTNCGEEKCAVAKRVLVDTGADMTCLSHSFSKAVATKRSLFNPFTAIRGINSQIERYETVWIEVIIRGITKKVQAAKFKSGQFEGGGVYDHDVLLGRDVMSTIFERGYSIGAV